MFQRHISRTFISPVWFYHIWCVCVCTCVCARVCVHACVCVRVHTRACVCVCVYSYIYLGQFLSMSSEPFLEIKIGSEYYIHGCVTNKLYTQHVFPLFSNCFHLFSSFHAEIIYYKSQGCFRAWQTLIPGPNGLSCITFFDQQLRPNEFRVKRTWNIFRPGRETAHRLLSSVRNIYC